MSTAGVSERWEDTKAKALQVMSRLEDIRVALEVGQWLARRLAGKPRAARRVLRQLRRPPTRGYWRRRGLAAEAMRRLADSTAEKPP